MTSWEVIEKRVKLAAEADFVICFYNPRSRGRPDHLAQAFEWMRPYKRTTTPVGIVKNAGRDQANKQEKWITTMQDIDFTVVDMKSMVIVGNKSTYCYKNMMITPRGYVV